MPSINGTGRDYQDCVNGPGVSDETYLTDDVRADMLGRYRVSHDPYEWGMTATLPADTARPTSRCAIADPSAPPPS